MTFNGDAYITPIYTGINDTPVEPSEGKGGNGADLIARLNGLIEELKLNLQIDFKLEIASSAQITEVQLCYFKYFPETVIVNNQSSNTTTYLDQSCRLLGFYANPGSVLDFSAIINAKGIGHYFFVAKKTDGSFAQQIKLTPISRDPEQNINTSFGWLPITIQDGGWHSLGQIQICKVQMMKGSALVRLTLEGIPS